MAGCWVADADSAVETGLADSVDVFVDVVEVDLCPGELDERFDQDVCGDEPGGRDGGDTWRSSDQIGRASCRERVCSTV